MNLHQVNEYRAAKDRAMGVGGDYGYNPDSKYVNRGDIEYGAKRNAPDREEMSDRMPNARKPREPGKTLEFV